MFANSENISLMNSVKNLIQKEEYISLAINKYILQTATIPKKDNSSLDWDKLMTDDYLGINFNKTNPLTSADLKVTFDANNNNVYIQGIINYDDDNNYLYNFYTNNIFRVNTIPPKNITEEKLVIGSQILYNDIQKEIVNVLNNSKEIKFPNQDCTINAYYYELNNSKLTYKYCKSDASSFEVYQEEPIYVENSSDLNYIRANIGTKAYVQNSDGSWSERYFTGYNDSDEKSEWTNESSVSEPTTELEEGESIQDKILSYIPNSKDLMLRRDGGCMLANGDIFCWGNNLYKKTGIENYGQLDNTLSPNYVNIPVMLKVQKSLTWYNNPYRIKFEKMALNSSNVCAVTPIFSNSTSKYGGDLYCNGSITSTFYEDMDTTKSESSILKRNIFISNEKSDEIQNANEIYLKDIVMVEDAVAVLSDTGKIYTFGKNYKGALGIGRNDYFFTQKNPTEVKNSGQVFKKIFALRDIKGFGAIDSNNLFYIWGERPNGTIYTEPTVLESSIEFNPDAIFTNSKDFILKGMNNVFYRTTGDRSFIALPNIPSTAISASIYDKNSTELYLYINKDLELEGSNSLISCVTNTGGICSITDSRIFDIALGELNTLSSNIDGQQYASFSNISIFQLDNVIKEYSDDFESEAKNWSSNTRTVVADNGDTTREPVTTYLGKFPLIDGTCASNVKYGYGVYANYNICTESEVDPYILSKTYSFPGYGNYEVEIEFDFYEIDSWDGERFEFWANGEKLAEDHFVKDNHQFLVDSNITGVSLQKNIGNNSGENPQKYRYKLRSILDSNGNLKIEFKTTLEFEGVADATEPPTLFDSNGKPIYGNFWSKFDEGVANESWGIDNVKIKLKETNKTFVCAMTGLGSASQMYCWGDVARTIPLLSTSLYDVSKIDTINKLFVTEESDKKEQMSFDNYYYDGKFWLKYPTYIAGFDYAFYFK